MVIPYIEAIHGDLNGDSRDDIVLMIQGTDQNKLSLMSSVVG